VSTRRLVSDHDGRHRVARSSAAAVYLWQNSC